MKQSFIKRGIVLSLAVVTFSSAEAKSVSCAQVKKYQYQAKNNSLEVELDRMVQLRGNRLNFLSLTKMANKFKAKIAHSRSGFLCLNTKKVKGKNVDEILLVQKEDLVVKN